MVDFLGIVFDWIFGPLFLQGAPGTLSWTPVWKVGGLDIFPNGREAGSEPVSL